MFQKVRRSSRSRFLAAVILLSQILAATITTGAGDTFRTAQAAEEADYPVYLPAVMVTSPSTFGVATNLSKDGLAAERQLREANTQFVRPTFLNWMDIESTKSSRDWNANAVKQLEKDLIAAARNGMQTILVVQGTPSWAQQKSGYSCGPIKQSELAAFAGFMFELVSRYSQPPFNVKDWEIYNEPDAWGVEGDNPYVGCWGEPDDPYYGGGYYGEALKAAYPEIKRADPQSRVWIGGLLLDCDPRPGGGCEPGRERPPMFLEGILRQVGGDYFDGVSFHAYDHFTGQLGTYWNKNWNSAWNTTGPVLISKARFIRSVLDQYGVQGKLLINTEAALVCGGSMDPAGAPGCESSANSVYEQTKASYVAQAYAAAAAENLYGNIWYSLFGWRNSGLMNTDRSLRPAFTAYKTGNQVLAGSAYQGDLTQFPGVKGYIFQHRGQTIWVLWSLDGSPHTVNLGGTPKSISDAIGQPVSAGATIEVGKMPLYIKW